MDAQAYLERIGYSGDTAPTLENLRAMHQAHFYNVPFENLDIKRGVRFTVAEEDLLFDKIVRRRRGGFCLELTGLFARMLREVGFSVDVLGARVFGAGFLSYPNSHMVSIVYLDEPWIADVGFGGRVIEPLRLNERGEQVFGPRRYVVANDGDHYFVTCDEAGNPPPMTYAFTLQPREFSEFNQVCGWLQTSPDSRFTKGDVVSLATPEGRITLADTTLITTSEGTREERQLKSDDERARVLGEYFGLHLDG
jgi:N-hydroxyarylamine O-acetyltransferase